MSAHDRSHADSQSPVPLPPGQVLVPEIPRDPAPTASVVDLADWELTLTTEAGVIRRWGWGTFRALPSESVTLDLHCVAGWSVLDTHWDAVAVGSLLDGVITDAEYVSVGSYSGYTTNLPLEDLLEMPTWLAFTLDGQQLPPAQGGPVRMLVPHLYLWKSVRWIRTITLSHDDHPGTSETRGYHNYGDPWRAQRLRDD